MKITIRCFTLLETLIAAALTIVLLSTVTYFYQQIDYINNQAEMIQKEGFKRLNLENRLSAIFPLVINEKNNDFYFFTHNDLGGIFKQGNSKSLIFTYDNQVDYNKMMSNHVIGELFLDPRGRLTLATWPSPKWWPEAGLPPMKKEILLEEVDSFKMSFFIPPDKKWNREKDKKAAPKISVKPTPEGGWVEEWSSDFKLLPGMIRLEIKRKGKAEYYLFPLSQTTRHIVYNQ